MAEPIDFGKKAKVREFIALLDQAIALGQELNAQLDEIDRLLAERYLKQAA